MEYDRDDFTTGTPMQLPSFEQRSAPNPGLCSRQCEMRKSTPVHGQYPTPPPYTKVHPLQEDRALPQGVLPNRRLESRQSPQLRDLYLAHTQSTKQPSSAPTLSGYRGWLTAYIPCKTRPKAVCSNVTA